MEEVKSVFEAEQERQKKKEKMRNANEEEQNEVGKEECRKGAGF